MNNTIYLSNFKPYFLSKSHIENMWISLLLVKTSFAITELKYEGQRCIVAAQLTSFLMDYHSPNQLSPLVSNSSVFFEHIHSNVFIIFIIISRLIIWYRILIFQTHNLSEIQMQNVSF